MWVIRFKFMYKYHVTKFHELLSDYLLLQLHYYYYYFEYYFFCLFTLPLTVLLYTLVGEGVR